MTDHIKKLAGKDAIPKRVLLPTEEVPEAVLLKLTPNKEALEQEMG